MNIIKTVEYKKHAVTVPSNDDDNISKVINHYTKRGWWYIQSVNCGDNTVELSFSKDVWQETFIDGKSVYEDLLKSKYNFDMKVKLVKLLRSCSAAWISSIEKEPIIGLLKNYWHSTYEPLKYGIEKGWIRVDKSDSKRDYYYFTEKGKDDILMKLKDTTCISGRVLG